MSIERGQISQHRRIGGKPKRKKEVPRFAIDLVQETPEHIPDTDKTEVAYIPHFETAVQDYIRMYGSLTHNPYTGKSEKEKQGSAPVDKIGNRAAMKENKSGEKSIALAILVLILASHGYLEKGIQYGVSTAQNIFSSNPHMVDPVPRYALPNRDAGETIHQSPDRSIVFRRSATPLLSPLDTPTPVETTEPTPFPQKGSIYGRRQSSF